MKMRIHSNQIVVLLLIWSFSVVAFSQQSLLKISADKKIEWLKNRAIAESVAVANQFPVRLERKDGTVIELQRMVNGMPKYYKTDNLSSAKTMSTIKVWPGGTSNLGLTGALDTLAEWDGGGIKTTHQEFGGRVLSSQGTISQHSTHVAGTILAAGVHSNAKGMSYEGRLRAYDWDSDESEMASAAAGGLKVSNHSYGLITGWDYNTRNDNRWVWFGDSSKSQTEDYDFGYYSTQTQDWDNIAYNAPYYVICKSAGNDRGEGPTNGVSYWMFVNGSWVLQNGYRDPDGGASGYDCISGAGLAKNVITVGAVGTSLSGYTGSGSVRMSTYSGWGPVDDGRIKPDLVATGDTVFSTIETSNTAYGYLSGTSMATPAVTGSLGLLLELQHRMHGSTPLLSSTWKGLLIETADEAGAANGPDYKFGFGQMNTNSAAMLMRTDSVEGYGSHIREEVLTEGSQIDIDLASDGATPFRATLCWTDPAGTPVAASADNPTAMLVNDLDLRLIRNVDGVVYYPWKLNPASPTSNATQGDNTVDNVEVIYAAPLAKGTYTLRVLHKGTLTGGSQNASILINGQKKIGILASYRTDTIKVSMNPNDTYTYNFRVFNNGDSVLNYNSDLDARDWLALVNDSNTVAYNDSQMIQIEFNTTGLSQWSTYTSSLTVESDDPSKPTKTFPIVLKTLGPKIAATPAAISMETEKLVDTTSTITIYNQGSATMSYWISSSSPTSADWLQVSTTDGTIAAGDSLNVILSFDATTPAIGDYATILSIASDDSVRGTQTKNVDFHLATRRTVAVNYTPKWNLVSVPIKTFSFARTAVFPNSITNAFSYSGSYSPQTTLNVGTGYWLKFDSSRAYDLDGYLSLVDSVDVTAGWNLIGSVSYPIAVQDVTSDPPGISTSEFYAYNSGYYTIDSIQPGAGYWVHTNQSGKLILSTGVTLAGATIHITPTRDVPPPPPDGSGTLSATIPSEYTLEQNYPNPFNPATVIRYSLADNGYVTLKVFNVLGEEVATLVNEVQDAGYKSVSFDASRLPSGIYMYKITTPSFSDVKRMMLVK